MEDSLSKQSLIAFTTGAGSAIPTPFCSQLFQTLSTISSFRRQYELKAAVNKTHVSSDIGESLPTLVRVMPSIGSVLKVNAKENEPRDYNIASSNFPLDVPEIHLDYVIGLFMNALSTLQKPIVFVLDSIHLADKAAKLILEDCSSTSS
jgi:predicted ATPase